MPRSIRVRKNDQLLREKKLRSLTYKVSKLELKNRELKEKHEAEIQALRTKCASLSATILLGKLPQ